MYYATRRVSGSKSGLWSISRTKIRTVNIDVENYEAALRSHEDVRSGGTNDAITPCKIDAVRNRLPHRAREPTESTDEIDPPSEALVEYANISATHERISAGALSVVESKKRADYGARMMSHGSS